MLETTTSQISKPHSKNNMKHEHDHATYMNTFHVYVYYKSILTFHKKVIFPTSEDLHTTCKQWNIATKIS